ncbi:16S rRNA (guanine(966)-N(2))-methyltransferase RsmD [Bacillus solitudinis]|uniref:16S rRNA (guanine(966)-N(2))-methyltransferase RsmD n=1 Tax=Bacillus solitudinis TaxID=2014074 RepID=UPI000C23BA26|nr:16S rRNA (guanine(966)-N(2))-methyltransferase RsmD [Bacillus solitudinis]
MRVISGEKKGLHLKAVPGSSTRPTTDKVKESIFNIIGPYFDGGTGLDLYGGSGGLGIEALSRGLDKVIFIDQDRKAIDTIKSNLIHCHFMDKAEVFRNDASRALKALVKREQSFSYIFLDPPYANQNIASEISIIDNHGLLEKNGLIVSEHAANISLAEKISELIKVREESYGDTMISIYQYED